MQRDNIYMYNLENGTTFRLNIYEYVVYMIVHLESPWTRFIAASIEKSQWWL